ncbi:MAG: IS630 family transposase [Bacteroidia bacterium]|nr:IS630 family transposase [Bacteroidia bacterium]
MPNIYVVTLTSPEREELMSIIHKGKHSAKTYRSAYVLLNTDEGEYQVEKLTNEAIAKVLKIGMRTIDRIKKQFVEEGLEACLSRRKSSREYHSKIDGDLEAHLIALSCGDPLRDFSKWSLRMLADKAVELNYVDKISHETVRQLLKNELKPWKVEGWVIPPKQNSEFVANMEMVLDVYKRPFSAKNPVVCMDESPKQLISETRVTVPMKKGAPKRIDYEYKRCGACNIFMSNEPLAGKRRVKVTERKTKRDWAEFVREIADNDYPEAEKITLVMDNLNTHHPSSLYEAFAPEEAKRVWDRFEFVYTPKHGSWLNMAEIELNVLNGQCLNRRIDNLREIITEVKAWQDARNQKDCKINWRFTTKDARIKLKRLYPSIED